MTLNEYITILQDFSRNNNCGHLPVAITQEGYYAQGKFADLFDEPEIKNIKDYVFVELGNSSQHY